MGDHEGTNQTEYDDNSMKTKIRLTRFGSTFGTLKFDAKTVFTNTLLGFTPYWVYKPTNPIHVDSLGVHTSEKILKLGTIDETVQCYRRQFKKWFQSTIFLQFRFR